MSDATTAVTDQAKSASALVDQAQSDLGSLDLHGNSVAAATAVEAAIARLDHDRHVPRHLVGAGCAHCPNDMDHYVDGCPVSSHLRFGNGTQYVYRWHPDPAHQMNRPHEIATVTTRNGTRKRIHVAAPGILDAVSQFEGCESPTWAPDW